MSDIQTIGVVGAGQMGNGIAHVFAQAGFSVLMQDISADFAAKGVAVDERQVQKELARLTELARAQITEEIVKK